MQSTVTQLRQSLVSLDEKLKNSSPSAEEFGCLRKVLAQVEEEKEALQTRFEVES